MSTSSLPRKPRVIGVKKTFAIVASLYNEPFVNALVEATRNEIQQIMPTASMPLYRVPGAGEIPVCAEYVVQHANADVVVALGVIIKGQTDHADLIALGVANALQEMACRNLIPIINEVLLVENEMQAKERCFGVQLNRGIEAARAATTMAELFQKLDTTYTPVNRGRSSG